MTLSRALYIAALGYVALVFFRPSEVISGWGDVRLVLAASVAITPMLIAAWWRRTALPIELPHDRWLLAYWVAIGASTVVSSPMSEAAAGVEQFAHIVFLYFLLRTAITGLGQLRGVIVVLVAAMLFHAIGAIVQHHTGVGWGGVTPYVERMARRSRSVGIFDDPNDLALGFLLVLPFLVGAVLDRGIAASQRAIAAAAAIPILIAFYYANSRGAVLGLAAGLAVYCWRRFGSSVGTPAAIVLVSVLLAVAPSRMRMSMTAREDSAQGRVQAWAAGLEMVKEHPVTGVGWNRYTEHYVRPAHNTFLHAFAELGLIGGICLIGIAYSFFWGLGWTHRAYGLLPASAANLEPALTSAGAAFFVDAFFLSKQYNVMTFTLVALGAVYVSIVNATRCAPAPGFGRREWLSIAAATATMFAAIWIAVRLLLITGA